MICIFMISYDSQFVKPFLRHIYFLFYVDKLPKLWCTDMNSLRLKTLQQDPYCRLWNCNFYIIFSAVGGSFGIFPAEPSAVLFSLHNVIRPKHAKCCTFQKVFLFFQKIFRAAWSVVRLAGIYWYSDRRSCRHFCRCSDRQAYRYSGRQSCRRV